MAVNMCVRSMSKIVKHIRPIAVKKPFNRFCTTASGAKEATKQNGVVEPDHSAESVDSKDIEQELKKAKEANEKLKGDISELTDKYKRSLAENENMRTRMQKQIDDAKMFGIQGFCKDLLEMADILHQATESTPKEEVNKNQHLKSLFEGLTMTNSQMLKVFSKHGLEQIDPNLGVKFDPFQHEALFEVPLKEGSEAGTIAVKQKIGYKLHERTLRPALVGVFKQS